MRGFVGCYIGGLLLLLEIWTPGVFVVMGLRTVAPMRRSVRLAGGKIGASNHLLSLGGRQCSGAAAITPTGDSGALENASARDNECEDDARSSAAAVVEVSGRAKTARKVQPTTEQRAKPVARALGRVREERKRAEGFEMVIGVDEAGRGPFAGPVVAAACFIPPEVQISGIQDSKKVSQIDDRETIYEELIAAPGVRWAACEVGSRRIDEINILEATKEAMTKCALRLCDEAPEGTKRFVLVDGNFVPPGLSATVDADCVIGGDGLEYCIAAASIIAKVTRDRIMIEYAKRWPVFGFEKHKGYGTQGHRDAIRQHGTVEIHRRSFLKNMEAEGKLREYMG